MLSSVVARSGGSVFRHHRHPRTAAAAAVGAVRNLNLHEYLSMELMKQHGIATPAGFVASTPEEAEHAFLHHLNKGTLFIYWVAVWFGCWPN